MLTCGFFMDSSFCVFIPFYTNTIFSIAGIEHIFASMLNGIIYIYIIRNRSITPQHIKYNSKPLGMV